MNRLVSWLQRFYCAAAQGMWEPPTPVMNRLFHMVCGGDA